MATHFPMQQILGPAPRDLPRIRERLAEVVLVVAVQLVGGVEGYREPCDHMVARGQVEPRLRLRVDGAGLLTTTGRWPRVKARPPVVGQPQRDRTLLVNANEVIGPLGDVLEGTGDVGAVRLEAQAVPDSRQGIEELSVADLRTVDVPGRRVDGPGYLVGNAANRLGRDRGLDVPVD